MTKAKIFELLSISTSSHLSTDFILLGQAKQNESNYSLLTSTMFNWFNHFFAFAAVLVKFIDSPGSSVFLMLELLLILSKQLVNINLQMN